MKKKIAIIICALISTQAFGWRITFDKNSHNNTYEILTFSKESDYRGMIKQITLGSQLIGFLGVIAPVAGKLGEYKIGQLKTPGTSSKPSTALVLASELPPQKYSREYSEAEIELIKLAINLGAKGVETLVKSGAIGNLFTKVTKEGYTIDFIKHFRPGAGLDSICRDAQSLAKHVIHKVKGNKEIFYVIVNKETGLPLFADWGPAYGDFYFRLATLTATETGEQIIVGDMTTVSSAGGTTCTAAAVEAPATEQTSTAAIMQEESPVEGTIPPAPPLPSPTSTTQPAITMESNIPMPPALPSSTVTKEPTTSSVEQELREMIQRRRESIDDVD